MKKKSKEKGLTFFERFTYKKNVKIILLVLFFVACLGFIVCTIVTDVYLTEDALKSIYENNSNNQSVTVFWFNLCSIFKDVFVVLTSTLGVNLLLSICLEKINQNKAFEDFFLNEIVSSPKFYENLSKEDKTTMLHALEANYYYNDSNIKKEMYKSITNKLKWGNERDYIVTECKCDVSCYIHEDYIEKRIIKHIEIVPDTPNYKVEKFPLLNITSNKIAGKDAVELEKVEIENVEIDIDKRVYKGTKPNENNLDKRVGYDEFHELSLKKPITFDKDNVVPKKITIYYKTRTPITDLSYTCRMGSPCKKFEFRFEVKDSSQYQVRAYAFGFIDDGKNTPNFGDNNKVVIQLNDWIFPNDGVTVFLNKVKN